MTVLSLSALENVACKRLSALKRCFVHCFAAQLCAMWQINFGIGVNPPGSVDVGAASSDNKPVRRAQKSMRINCFNPLKANSSNYYTLPYRPNLPFLISDIRALWRSVLGARVPKCQKLKMVGQPCMALDLQSVAT